MRSSSLNDTKGRASCAHQDADRRRPTRRRRRNRSSLRVDIPVADAVDGAEVAAVAQHHERRPAREAVAPRHQARAAGQQQRDAKRPRRIACRWNDHREVERLLVAFRVFDEHRHRRARLLGPGVEAVGIEKRGVGLLDETGEQRMQACRRHRRIEDSFMWSPCRCAGSCGSRSTRSAK
jgi:hypothetical protein